MNRRRGAALAAVTVALALWLLSAAGRALVIRAPVDPPEAIVALASHEWERLPEAAALAARFPASAVLLTEPAEISDANCHLCGERPAWLRALGVAPGRIHVLPERGRGTRDEALAVRRYVERHHVRRLAIVTSPYHARRASATFGSILADLPVQIGIYPATGHSPARPDRWWRAAYDRAYVLYEWTALVHYRVKHGIPLSAAPSGASSPGTARRPDAAPARPV